MTAIILAAGYATRLYPLTIDKPKALLKIGKKTILDYLLAEIDACGIIDNCYIITNAKFFNVLSAWAEDIKNNYKNIKINVLNDGTSSNETRLGAIGDVAYVIKQTGIDDDCLIAASDNLCNFSLSGFFETFKETGINTVVACRLYDINELRRFAVLKTDEHGIITDLKEKPENPEGNLAACAIYAYKKETVRLINTYLKEGGNQDAPGYFLQWIYSKKPVKVWEGGKCVDIGTVATYEQAVKDWADKQ